MAKRREFTPTQKREIKDRAKNEIGQICCEKCHIVLGKKPFEIDHIIPEGDRPDADKQRKLTIAEGQLLGVECCHRGPDGKTAQDQKNIAKGNRRIDKDSGIKRPAGKIKSAPFTRSERAAAREARAVTKLPMPDRRGMYVKGELFAVSANPEIRDSE